MGLEFVQCSLYFPALMIQRGQFCGWSFFVIKNRRKQAVDGFRTLNSFQAIFYDSNDNAIFFSPLILPRVIDSAQVRAIRKPFFAWQTKVFLNSPEQI